MRKRYLGIAFSIVLVSALSVLGYRWDQTRLRYASVFPEGHSIILNSFDGEVRVGGRAGSPKLRLNEPQLFDVSNGAIARVTFAAGWYVQFDGPGGFEVREQLQNAKGTESEIRVTLVGGVFRAMALPAKEGEVRRLRVDFADGTVLEKEGGELGIRIPPNQSERVAWFSGSAPIQWSPDKERRTLQGTGLNAF